MEYFLAGLLIAAFAVFIYNRHKAAKDKKDTVGAGGGRDTDGSTPEHK